jgi:hypothetical protein
METHMALLEKHRNTIYTEFVKLLGEEATEAMLSQFPARDVEEPVTRQILATELAQMESRLRDQLTNRMLSIAGLGLVAITGLLAVFT